MDHAMGMDMGAPPPSPSSAMAMHRKMTMMHMTFFWGSRVDVLFSGWPGDRGLPMYLLALLSVLAAALLVELLAFLSTPHRLPASCCDGTRLSWGLRTTALDALRKGLSYLVMLAVMSFNAGVLLAAVAGHALGFFVFHSGVFFAPSAAGGEETNGGDHHQRNNKC